MIYYLKDIANEMKQNPNKIMEIFNKYNLNEVHKQELIKDFGINFAAKKEEVKKEDKKEYKEIRKPFNNLQAESIED